ncbi:hypothetical protein AJ80_05914 [Polytolypa hystricis UAMH7299]|uniref:SH3 domain-containing protein n=1 Tax=Polytolypa hystricis (strain UAMH7299) TaxID=1447883 RepID=A0A2B7XZX4_POLH7|nr:hypothetical protein AJ80_05914 [Polytolypa hystricis UAMH7299]
MTRPQIIRADTIDLQDHNSPSAQDHSRHAKSGNGRLGAHQDQSMRNVEQETQDELLLSPRVSEEIKRREDDQEGPDVYGDRRDMRGDYSSAQNGHYSRDAGMSSDEGDLTDGDGDDHLDDDMMDKMSSSPSIDDEDIDFEFVYAFHTFVATVEGQANATKGDTMVLLDDSNSYWWLVRVVKDGSIGYLPAEHIETPLERVARLNKHRNIDLSATMLADNAEKSKNPLKKAMRRRNAKNVTFAPPQYFEASDIEYSTEEEGEETDDQFFDDEDEGARSDTQETHDEEEDEEEGPQTEEIVIEPLRPKQVTKDIGNVSEDKNDSKSSLDKVRSSEESYDTGEVAVSRSRNGTVRNTDSFFKDDTVETRKISLTPNLLRDDAVNNSLTTEPKEMKGRSSFETLDKVFSGDKNKDDKKRKEKKPGMLSGLFKRKDRKSKAFDDDVEESEKVSEESTRSMTPPKTSSELSKEEARSSKPQTVPQRTPSKLQKSPPETSPVKSEHNQGPSAHAPIGFGSQQLSSAIEDAAPKVHPAPVDIQHDVGKLSQPPEPAQGITQLQTLEEEELDADEAQTVSSPIKTTFLDTSVSSVDFPQHTADASSNPRVGPSTASAGHNTQPTATDIEDERLSESPVNVTRAEAREPNNPPLTVDTSNPSHVLSSPSPPSSPELIEVSEMKPDDATTSATASSVSQLMWSDAGLRAYMEDDNDIRDLLIIVHDKSNILPAGPDHPITGGLFKEESKQLVEMSNRLDDMLNGWMARRQAAPVKS